MARTQANRQIDGRLLPLDLPRAFVAVGMGEVGREADHRGDLAGLLHGPDDRIDVLRLEAAKPAVVVLDAFPAQCGRIPDPLFEGAGAVDELVEVALGEDADPGGHRVILVR